MAALDLSHFAITDPHVTTKGCDLHRVGYAELNYSSRIKALLEATRDAGKPLALELFNDLLNGRRSVAYVRDYVAQL